MEHDAGYRMVVANHLMWGGLNLLPEDRRHSMEITANIECKALHVLQRLHERQIPATYGKILTEKDITIKEFSTCQTTFRGEPLLLYDAVYLAEFAAAWDYIALISCFFPDKTIPPATVEFVAKTAAHALSTNHHLDMQIFEEEAAARAQKDGGDSKMQVHPLTKILRKNTPPPRGAHWNALWKDGWLRGWVWTWREAEFNDILLMMGIRSTLLQLVLAQHGMVPSGVAGVLLGSVKKQRKAGEKLMVIQPIGPMPAFLAKHGFVAQPRDDPKLVDMVLLPN